MADSSTQPTTEANRPRNLAWKDYATLTKAKLSIMVVVTTFLGYWLARGWGDLGWKFIHTVFGTTLTAFGAAVFNQVMEIGPDRKMQRTADRPLAARRMTVEMAFIIGWLLSALGIIHLGVRVNFESCALAALTLAIYIFVYTPMKRRSTLNTLVGAVSGALPPVIGWVAGKGGGAFVGPNEGYRFEWQLLIAPQAIFLFGLLFLWQLPHFLAINWVYREEYIRGGFVMVANEDVEGRKTARQALYYSVALALLALQPWLSGFASPAFAVIGLAAGGWLVWLSWKFFKQPERSTARKLFFGTLLYLPPILAALVLLRK
jgi:heme o synthase